MLININVLDGEKLMATNKNPDLCPDFVVRVTGFTAYFASKPFSAVLSACHG